ncbi:Predicted oxidoreductase [Pseudorhodobacter antarcticus]|uniref:Predicted oxidoreductase n=1 Tax=Pseudorhodobacter antarcticus TaxID=1077947 RepID=A0A1H8H9H4_9RHOB|nr:aldo/keto reductase [Pseudorhodobacter antarcticus]SEN52913.1 Predicted oxidoreductase [Pseudorhodobacter antarcticus]
MDRITLDTIDLSRLVYGMWRLGDDTDTSPKHVQAKIESCLAQGITSFDQADIYGGYSAEALLGHALRAAPGLRNQMEIITKCDIVAPVGRHAAARVKHYDTSAAHINASVDASLSDMAIDHIDLLLIHRPDPLMDHMETGAALDALVASGKVRAVGVSNFRPWDVTLLQSGMTNRLCTNQIELSLVAHQGFTNSDVAFHQERSIPLMAWSPLAGGRLLAESGTQLRARLAQIGADHGTDWSAAAVAWLLRHPARIIPVLGTNSLARIGTIATALEIEMDRQTWFELYTLIMGHEVA